MFRNLNLFTKLLISFFILSLLLGGVGWLSVSSFDSINVSLNKTRVDSLPILNATSRISNLWFQTIITAQQFALSGDEIYKVKTDATMLELEQEINTFGHIVKREEEKILSKKLQTSFSILDRNVQQLFTTVETGKSPPPDSSRGEVARKTIASKATTLTRTQVAIKNLLESREFIINDINQVIDTLELKASNTRKSVIVFVLISLVLSLVIAFFVARSISKSVTAARNAAVEIARGNMDVEVDITGKDEVAELSQAIDKVRRSLKVVMEKYEKKIK